MHEHHSIEHCDCTAHALPNTKSALSLKAMPNLRAVEQAQQN